MRMFGPSAAMYRYTARLTAPGWAATGTSCLPRLSHPDRGESVRDRRHATAAAAPPEPGLGGPSPACDPARCDTESAAIGAAAAGHPGHGPALAPRHRLAPLDRQVQARQDRQAS